MIDFDIQLFADISNSTSNTIITGTNDADSIYNWGDNVTINALGGNDTIGDFIGANVSISGGEGDDITETTNYGANITINGGAGNDTIINSNYDSIGNIYEYNNGDGNDVIDSLKSNDSLIINGTRREIIRENDGDIVIEVGSNSITIQHYTVIDYYTNNTTIIGTGYSDNIYHFYGSNVSISGGNGNDYIESFHSDNVTIDGGAGDDTLLADGSNVTISGGDGNDYIEIYSRSNVTVSGGEGNDTICNVNDWSGYIYEYNNGDGNDIITGFAADNTLIVEGTTYTKQVSGNDWIISAGNGSIILQDAASISPVILNPSTSTPVVKNGNSYTYYGGDGAIENYAQGEQINLASDFTGIGLDDNNFYVNSSSGSLKIENARDKLISYGTADGNLVAYSFMANNGGDIDFRSLSQFEIIIGANNQNNQIYAGSGGSSLWGGAGGNDILTGGDGYDEFFFAQGCGGDVIQNAGDNDLINLLGVTLDQITSANVSELSVNISLIDGSSLNVEGNANVGYKVEGKIYACNHSTGEWYEK